MVVHSTQDIPPPNIATKRAKIEEPPVVTGYQSFPASHEITGYMPYREEFEVCFDNEAEVSIKDLVFMETDKSFDVRLKKCMLDIYSGTLDRRAGRQDFALQHGLINYKAQVALDKTRPKEERDVLNQIKPFARFMRTSDFDELTRGLVKEGELRKRIASLQEYRRAGIRRMDEAHRYEHEKKQLELYLKSGGAAIIHRPIKEPHPLPVLPSRESHTITVTTTTITSPTDSQSTQAPSTSTQGRKASAPLNISHADGIDLLTEKERELCSILRLYPRVYLHIKDTLIKEYLHHGGLKRAQARAAVKIDVNKTSRLYDFFVAAGWIKAPAGDHS